MTVPMITIGIAGGSGAGKTTLANKLFETLGGEENVSYLVHDAYYKDLARLEPKERAQTNFDHPDSLDTYLLIKDIQNLKQGKTCKVPVYDFTTHSRRSDQFDIKEPRKIVLVEGILLFCDRELCQELDIKVFVEADSDIRLSRRLSRDIKERGRTVEDVLEQYHKTVRPMHQEYVEPSKRSADLIVHSYGHSMVTAVDMITNHLRTVADL